MESSFLRSISMSQIQLPAWLQIVISHNTCIIACVLKKRKEFNKTVFFFSYIITNELFFEVKFKKSRLNLNHTLNRWKK